MHPMLDEFLDNAATRTGRRAVPGESLGSLEDLRALLQPQSEERVDSEMAGLEAIVGQIARANEMESKRGIVSKDAEKRLAAQKERNRPRTVKLKSGAIRREGSARITPEMETLLEQIITSSGKGGMKKVKSTGREVSRPIKTPDRTIAGILNALGLNIATGARTAARKGLAGVAPAASQAVSDIASEAGVTAEHFMRFLDQFKKPVKRGIRGETLPTPEQQLNSLIREMGLDPQREESGGIPFRLEDGRKAMKAPDGSIHILSEFDVEGY